MNRIIKIHNLKQLLPRYPHHWVILAQKQPVIEYEASKPHQSVNAYLWYNMAPEKLWDTNKYYFREKLGIIDDEEADTLITKWNRSLSHQPVEIEFNQVFPIGNSVIGIANDPKHSNRCIIMATYPVRAPYCEHVPVGGGGYMWQYLERAPLRDDRATHQMLAERFALWDQKDRIKLLRSFNGQFEN